MAIIKHEAMKTEELRKILRGKCVSDESCEAAIIELLDLFNVSGTPTEQAISLIDGMTADQRFDVFGEYCTHCGDKDPRCQCWNDE